MDDEDDLNVWKEADANAQRQEQERRAAQAAFQAEMRLRTAIHNVCARRAIPEQGEAADWTRWAQSFCELWRTAESVGRGRLFERLIAHFRRPAVTDEFYKIAAHIFELAKQGHFGRIEQCLRHAKCKEFDGDGRPLSLIEADATGRLVPLMEAVAEFCRKLETFQPDAESFEPPPQPTPEPLPLDEQIRAVFHAAINLAEYLQRANAADGAKAEPFNPVECTRLQMWVFKPLDAILEHSGEIPPAAIEELHELVSVERLMHSFVSLPDAYTVLANSGLEGIGWRGLRAMQIVKPAAVYPAVPVRAQDTKLPPGLVLKFEQSPIKQQDVAVREPAHRSTNPRDGLSMKGKIFIGHGRSPVWRELKEFPV